MVFTSLLLRLACPSKRGGDNRVDGGQGQMDKWKCGCSEEQPTFDGAAASSGEREDPLSTSGTAPWCEEHHFRLSPAGESHRKYAELRITFAEVGFPRGVREVSRCKRGRPGLWGMSNP